MSEFGGNPDNLFGGDHPVERVTGERTLPGMDEKYALEGIRSLLRMMGEDPDREGLEDTPRRVIDAFMEMTDAPGRPDVLLGRTFSDINYQTDQMVAVGPVHFTSLCEHHLLPFTGVVHVAYIPKDGVVVGLSKIPRVVEHYAKRPQVQERMTSQIADAIETHLQPQGVAVLVVAHHSCMGLRGVHKPDAKMTTSAMHGAFRDNQATRDEFLSLARNGLT